MKFVCNVILELANLGYATELSQSKEEPYHYIVRVRRPLYDPYMPLNPQIIAVQLDSLGIKALRCTVTMEASIKEVYAIVIVPND